MAVLRGVLWLLFGVTGMWLGMWALLILNSYVPVVLLFVVAVVALGLIEERRQKRARERAEDLGENISVFLLWQRVQTRARLRPRLEELRERARREAEEAHPPPRL